MEELKITAESLKKQAKPAKKETCYVCGRHQFITETFRITSLKECADIFNNDYYDVNTIHMEQFSLCPNCHKYMRILRGDFKVAFELGDVLKDIYTGSEMEKILYLQSKMYRVHDKLRKREDY